MSKTLPIRITSQFGINTFKNGSEVAYNISPVLELPKGTSFRVVEANIWWSIPNISPELNNDTIVFTTLGTTYTYTFVKGIYDVGSINANLLQFMISNALDPGHIVFSGDVSNSRISVRLDDPTTTIDWSLSTIRSVLGYADGSVTGPGPSGTHYEAPLVAQFNSITSILIHSNFAGSGYYNERGGSSVIASVVPDTTPGSLILFRPLHLIEVGVTVSKIDALRIWLTDQNGLHVDTNGESFTITGQFMWPQ